MERLFRQRMEYVSGGQVAGCFLCDLADAEPSPGGLLLARSDGAVAVLNKYPYNTGHLVVAPRRHVGNLEDLSTEEMSAVMQLVTGSISIIKELMNPQGFNLGANLGKVAGAGLPDHVHMHVVPRWDGDTNFMPVVGKAKVLPEPLEDTYARLRAGWDAKER